MNITPHPTEENIVVVSFKSGLKLDVHSDSEYISIDTPHRMWDVTVTPGGRLILDGHDVQELIDTKIMAGVVKEKLK